MGDDRGGGGRDRSGGRDRDMAGKRGGRDHTSLTPPIRSVSTSCISIGLYGSGEAFVPAREKEKRSASVESAGLWTITLFLCPVYLAPSLLGSRMRSSVGLIE